MAVLAKETDKKAFWKEKDSNGGALKAQLRASSMRAPWPDCVAGEKNWGGKWLHFRLHFDVKFLNLEKVLGKSIITVNTV